MITNYPSEPFWPELTFFVHNLFFFFLAGIIIRQIKYLHPYLFPKGKPTKVHSSKLPLEIHPHSLGRAMRQLKMYIWRHRFAHFFSYFQIQNPKLSHLLILSQPPSKIAKSKLDLLLIFLLLPNIPTLRIGSWYSRFMNPFFKSCNGIHQLTVAHVLVWYFPVSTPESTQWMVTPTAPHSAFQASSIPWAPGNSGR